MMKIFVVMYGDTIECIFDSLEKAEQYINGVYSEKPAMRGYLNIEPWEVK